METRRLSPSPRPISAVLESVSQVLSNFIKRNQGTSPPLPTPAGIRPRQGNAISGFTPAHRPLTASQTRGCVYLLGVRGKGSEGNRIESVTGCNKLKSLLLLLLLLRRPGPSGESRAACRSHTRRRSGQAGSERLEVMLKC